MATPKSNKMTRTETLLEVVENNHEWGNDDIRGNPGWNGNVLISDTCTVCGLERTKYTWHDRADEYRFENSSGEELTLKEAAELEC
jgi:hypothetical protein